MKKLCILTDESIISGSVKTGVAELADSLAASMVEFYEVHVVAPDCGSIYTRMAQNLLDEAQYVKACKLFGINYHVILPEHFAELSGDVIETIGADIFHNLGDPCFDLAHVFSARKIYTIDAAEFLEGKEDCLLGYDAVTTVSEGYADEIIDAGGDLAFVLRQVNFRGITNGILDPAYKPEEGLFIPAPYTSADFRGKEVARKKILRDYGIPGDPVLFLMMCRMVQEKGVPEVIEVLPQIRDAGGFVLFVGAHGDPVLRRRVETLKRRDGGIWAAHWASPTEVVELLAAADFYLSPSRKEPCGLTAMKACRFAAIPVTTLVGGLSDNMDEDFALIIRNGVEPTALQAIRMHGTAEETRRRALCMQQNFGWSRRRQKYVELYETSGDNLRREQTLGG